jgi:hypothetical protein
MMQPVVRGRQEGFLEDIVVCRMAVVRKNALSRGLA